MGACEYKYNSYKHEYALCVIAACAPQHGGERLHSITTSNGQSPLCCTSNDAPLSKPYHVAPVGQALPRIRV